MRKLVWVATLLFLPTWTGLWAQDTGELESRLRFAATQHEIITILIKEEQFDAVLPEFLKILDLDFTGPNEKLVVKETWVLVDELIEGGHYDLAHQLINEAIESTEEVENLFTLLMLKGKVFKQQGRLAEAIETYREAQRLQQ